MRLSIFLDRFSMATHPTSTTVNSQQSTVNSQQSTVNSQQSTVNSQLMNYKVIYDGNCNLCVTLVQLLENLDQGKRFEYISMQDLEE